MNTNTITGNKFRLSADVIVNDFISETYKKFRLYPNPAQNYITIEYQVPNDKGNYLIITDVKGVRLMVFAVKGYWGEKIVDLRDVKPGVYMVRLQSNGKTLQTGKFVKH
jgi:hypothetical protein